MTNGVGQLLKVKETIKMMEGDKGEKSDKQLLDLIIGLTELRVTCMLIDNDNEEG